MSRETGKQRASGIPLDYFRHRNPFDRGKLILAGIAAVGAIGWLAVGSLSGQKMETWFSPGPVSAAHAMWENDCQKCHVSFTPIGGDAAAAAFVGDKAAIDANCRSCHQDIATKSSPGWTSRLERSGDARLFELPSRASGASGIVVAHGRRFVHELPCTNRRASRGRVAPLTRRAKCQSI